ncbi:hypothetical protein GALMADRAFT_144647 [Galerina marginata CBS 339.88]|uniref:Uncharacterized protein n=1 Tax=Galerina marginata (strain CBS 339.88) TaxID=685588 RepID=A0A067SJZ7_GALM3|nr:hypothetical protein GALMADRAFT_144647 [Galerina marginata CBS 339.88]
MPTPNVPLPELSAMLARSTLQAYLALSYFGSGVDNAASYDCIHPESAPAFTTRKAWTIPWSTNCSTASTGVRLYLLVTFFLALASSRALSNRSTHIMRLDDPFRAACSLAPSTRHSTALNSIPGPSVATLLHNGGDSPPGSASPFLSPSPALRPGDSGQHLAEREAYTPRASLRSASFLVAASWLNPGVRLVPKMGDGIDASRSSETRIGGSAHEDDDEDNDVDDM